jgi:hypothetical protein
MTTHQIYHKLNILSDVDFTALVQYKDSIINQGKGAVVFDKTGSVSVNTELKMEKVNVQASDYTVSKEAIVNYQCNIENFIKIYGQPFYPVFKNIQNALIDIGVENPRPYTARAYRHNSPNLPWHKHSNVFRFKPSDLWISIFYLHPNWDTKFGGGLRVGLIETEDLLIADCLSNSAVIHNGYYGHGVLKLHPGFEGNRDILFIQWVSENGYKDVFC